MIESCRGSGEFCAAEARIEQARRPRRSVAASAMVVAKLLLTGSRRAAAPCPVGERARVQRRHVVVGRRVIGGEVHSLQLCADLLAQSCRAAQETQNAA